MPSTATASAWLVVGTLIAIRAALGVAQAALFPLIQGPILIRWLPPSRWAFASSLVNVGLTLGGAAAGPLIAWLVLAYGWRESFFMTAPIAFALAVAWWWFYRDDPAQHRGVNADELAAIRSERAEPAPADWRHGLSRVFANREIVMLTVSYALVSYLSGFFYNWFYYYLVESRHVSATLAGTLTGALWIVGSVCALLGGVFCDWLGARRGAGAACRIIGIVGVLLIAPLMVLGARASGPASIAALLALAFGMTQMTDVIYWVAAMRVAGSRTVAATGLMNTGANAALGVGALAFPMMGRRFGWDHSVASGAIAAIAAAVCWLWIDADRPMVEPDADA